jgi:hypothetical protein
LLAATSTESANEILNSIIFCICRDTYVFETPFN